MIDTTKMTVTLGAPPPEIRDSIMVETEADVDLLMGLLLAEIRGIGAADDAGNLTRIVTPLDLDRYVWPVVKAQYRARKRRMA